MASLQADPLVVRSTALPIRYWLTGANPTLFRSIEAFQARSQASAASLQETAKWVGDVLVPMQSLTKKDRSRLLALRRRLHGGKPIGQRDVQFAAALANSSGCEYLAARLAESIEQQDELVSMSDTIDKDIAAEAERLLRLPGLAISDSDMARLLLDDAVDPGMDAPQKKRRRFFERSWRVVTRATTDATPRGWMSHVGLMTEDAGSAIDAGTARMSKEFHAHWTQSVRAQRQVALATSDDDWPDAHDQFGANPLSWTEDGEYVAIVLDHHAEPSCVVLRDNDALQRVLTSVGRGPITVECVCSDLGLTSSAQQADLKAYLCHLRDLGVIQSASTPATTLKTIHLASGPESAPREAARDDGWTDVYRAVERNPPPERHASMRQGLNNVLRALRSMDAAGGATTSLPGRLETGSWSFTEILKNSLAQGNGLLSNDNSGEHAEAEIATAAALTPLLHYISERRQQVEINIPFDLINELDASDCAVPWPVDCLVRIADSSAPFELAVVGVWPAGTLDSRFADGLHHALGSTTLVDNYRCFLQEVEQRTDIKFVEILAPPYSHMADNAVRRPHYTSAWTGDPNRGWYISRESGTSSYIPLRDIEFRATKHGMESRFDGQRLWPIYHATRTFSAPWDKVAQALLMTAPLSIPASYRRPGNILRSALPSGRIPRVTIDGIVLAPSQWLIEGVDFWDRGDSLSTKVRRLVSIREQLGLPRWAEVSDPQQSVQIACDLESLATTRTIDHLLALHPSLHLKEMLPTPEQLWLRDAAYGASDRVASELVVRLPDTRAQSELAQRVARDVRKLSSPGAERPSVC